ncbi:alpha/beta hydrolase [Noviherbaspirillum sp.]|jgi:pimeloyl-ACP methyl ester carboxylesterase|uniref:alpha/beta fold hydrolase n=1 Tax=Noviherbaspirillum sp. TaxID=1926288 RepID=UPI0025E2141A|nr:alpha/beta hydrolase [Noviherbaspirillum sp.]
MGTDYLIASGRRLEYRLTRVSDASRPTLVLLHEGLGSLSMWRDFPERLATMTGCSVLVYSRYGYGWSDVLAEPRDAGYLFHEALVSLPEILKQLDISKPVLIGHSDGGSIALIHAGNFGAHGVVVLAPHIYAEVKTLLGAKAIREQFEKGVLGRLLQKYHRDPVSTFYGWNDAWLSEQFRSFDITPLLSRISCPVLGIQGCQDEHGSMVHIDEIATRAKDVQLVKLDECRHSPHIDQRDKVLHAIDAFCRRLH